MPQQALSLDELAKFDNLFHKENLLRGLRVWLRTTGLTTVAGLLAALFGLMHLLPELTMFALTGLNIFLFQWTAGQEARRYGFPVSTWCWWSIIWRLVVAMLPVIFVLTLAGGPIEPGTDGMLTDEDLQRLSMAQLVIAVVSIVPMGMVTSQALLASRRKFEFFGGTPFSGGGDYPSRDESNKKTDVDGNGETDG
jgi:hypothetical protein